MGRTRLAPVSLAMFYGADRDFANAFSVRVTLKNPVEPEPLRRALDRAMERYPYFAVRLAVRGEELVLEDNPLPVTIVKGPEPAKLSTAASNFHLVGVSYERTSVIFGAFHALTDGAGAFHWIKTTLYYYLCETEAGPWTRRGCVWPGRTSPPGSWPTRSRPRRRRRSSLRRPGGAAPFASRTTRLWDGSAAGTSASGRPPL